MNRELPDVSHHITSCDVDSSKSDDARTEAPWGVSAYSYDTDQVDILQPWSDGLLQGQDDITQYFEHDAPAVLLSTEHSSPSYLFDTVVPWSSETSNSPLETLESRWSSTYSDPDTTSTSFDRILSPQSVEHLQPYMLDWNSVDLASHSSTYFTTYFTTSSVRKSESPNTYPIEHTLSDTSISHDVGSDVVSCPTCNATFTGLSRKGNLARHERARHPKTKGVGYQCEDNDCRSMFGRPDARLLHYRRHHPNLVDSWDSRGPSRKRSSIKQEKEATSGEQEQNNEPVLASMDQHRRSAVEPFDEQEISSLSMSGSFSLQDSPNVYTDLLMTDEQDLVATPSHNVDSNGRFICTLCESTFRRLADLRRHEHKHEQPLFPCEVPGCEREFYRMDKLRDHVQKVHHGTLSTTDEGHLQFKVSEEAKAAEQPSSYKCTECELSFQTLGQRTYHFNRKHNKRFKCGDCDKAFSLRADLDRHKVNRHRATPERFYHCPNKFCACPNKVFTRKDNYNRHVQRCQKTSASSIPKQPVPLPSNSESSDGHDRGGHIFAESSKSLPAKSSPSLDTAME